MDKLTKITDILTRLKKESPDFFKKLQVYGWVFSLILLVVALFDLAGILTLPDGWDTTLYVIDGILFGGAVVSHLPVKSLDGPGPGGEPIKPPAEDPGNEP